MPAIDPLTVWNLALSDVRADEVASLSEQSLEARECRRHYPHALGIMLEGPHDFGFAKKRSTLAVRINDRAGEWAFAYEVPGDMASPIRLVPNLDGIGVGVPVPLPGDPYAETWGASWVEQAYVVEGGVLYANSAAATLEYVRSNIDGLAIPQMMVDALAKELASRIAVPVKGDRDLKQRLQGEAEVAWQRAIADDRNRQPDRTDYLPEGIAARHFGVW